jgi:hypothetical protein
MLLLEASTSAPLGSPPWRLATRDSIGVVGSYPPPRPVNASSPPPPQGRSRTSPKQGSVRSPSMQPWLPLPLRKGSDHAVRGSQVLLSAPSEGPSVLSDLLPRSRTSSSTIGILSPLVDEGFPSQRPVVGPLAARVMPGSGTSERLSPLFGAVRFLGLLGRLRQGFPWRSPSSVIRLFESPKGSSFVPVGRLSASDLTQSAPSDQDRVFSVFFASRRRTSGTSTFSGSHGRTPSAATLQSGSSRKRLLLGAHHVLLHLLADMVSSKSRDPLVSEGAVYRRIHRSPRHSAAAGGLFLRSLSRPSSGLLSSDPMPRGFGRKPPHELRHELHPPRRAPPLPQRSLHLPLGRRGSVPSFYPEE